MPNFSVPNQINPGDSLDANKAMANWNQVVTDLNGSGSAGGGKIDATNTVASFAKDVVEPTFSNPRPVTPWLWARVDNSTLTTHRKVLNDRGADVGAAAVGIAAPIDTALYFKAAEIAAGSRSSKLQLVAAVATNAVAPACNITVALNPVSTYIQGSSGNPSGFQVSTTAVVGSSITFTTPGAIHSIFGDDPTSVAVSFAYPSSQWGALTLAVSGTPAAGSVTEVLAQLRILYA